MQIMMEAVRLCEHLQDKLSATMEANKFKKARRMKSPKNNTITEFCKKSAMKMSMETEESSHSDTES